MLQLILAAGTLAVGVPAGEIFGDLKLDAKYLVDAQLKLTCGAETAEVKTDKTGSFRLTVKGSGKCALSVAQGNQTVSIDVVVFEKPAQYHLVLEMKDGKYTLKRV